MGSIIKKEGTHPIAAIASAVVPGLGQLFKGHFFKALLFAAFTWIAMPVIYFILGWFPLVGWVVGAFAWLVNVLDAWVSNSR